MLLGRALVSAATVKSNCASGTGRECSPFFGRKLLQGVQCMHQCGWLDKGCLAKGIQGTLPERCVDGVGLPRGYRGGVEAAHSGMQ